MPYLKNFTDKTLIFFCKVYVVLATQNYKCFYTTRGHEKINPSIAQYDENGKNDYKPDISSCQLM